MSNYRLVFSGLLLLSGSLYATPNFAREYSADCTTCHTMVPVLNETGESFLRNGFRFSSGERSTLQKLIDPQKDESRPIPLAVMLNANYDTDREDVQEKVKLYTGGTLNENLSFFGMTKENFDGNSDNQNFFERSSSRAYAQLNLKEAQHVVRVGLISPLTQFGNIQKASADAGLKGHNSNSDGNGGNGADQGAAYGRVDKYGPPTTTTTTTGGMSDSHGADAMQGGSHYQTPLQNVRVGTIKGAEYSYLADNRWMVLVSYGESVEKGGGSDNGNSDGQNISVNGDDDYQMMGGVRYLSEGGYRVGLIYNQFEQNGVENFSALLPIEKRFEKLHLTSTLVYKDSTTNEEPYYGWENALIYPLSESDYLRGVVDLDQQDGDSAYGLSLGYSKWYKFALFHLTGVRKSTPEEDDNMLVGSVSLLF